MKFGCVNVRGWGLGKYEDVCKEFLEWKFDLIGVTETHLKGDIRIDEGEYVMIGKGRKKQDKSGGGVAFLHRKEGNYKVDEIDVGDNEMSEDVLAVRVECMDQHEQMVKFIVVVVYMTVEGGRAARENWMKLDAIRKVLRENAGERVMVMGDMNAHLGMLGEQMNGNGEMLADFIDEMNLENLNETLAEGRVTWSARDQTSAIDYVLVNGRMREYVTRMWIDEDGMIDIVSDHNMLVVDCMMNARNKRDPKTKDRKRKWKLTVCLTTL